MAGINMGAAAPGLGRLALAIGGGPQGAYQKGYDNELSLQSKLAQALATINASNATARLHGLQADEAQGQLDARKPEAVLGSALTAYGIPTDESSAVADFLKTGQLGGKYRPLPADQQGPTVPAPDWAGKLGAVARSVGTFNQAVGLGDKSMENLAKAEAIRRGQQLSNDIIAGKQDPTRVATAEYAVSGKAPYDFKEFGVGNNLTGQVDASSVPAQNFARYRSAEASNANAGAAAHNAAADASRASAAKTRQEMEQGVKTGALQVVTGEDGSVNIVNKATGKVTPAVGPDGNTFIGKGQNLNMEQANALTFAQRMQAADQVLGQLAARGITTPGGTKLTANALGDGMLGEAARATANFVQSPEQQQVEQAQRDFVNAVLRRESGAAISIGEFKNAAQQYFPQPGDSPAVIRQKAAARKRVIDGMYQAVPANRRPAAGVAPPVAPETPTGPVQIKSDADYNALPSGAEFIAPDGSHRRKP